jgi:hypothetical protein
MSKLRCEYYREYEPLQSERFKYQFARYIRRHILSMPHHRRIYDMNDWTCLTKDETKVLFLRLAVRFKMSGTNVERFVRGLHYTTVAQEKSFGCRFNFDGNFGLFQLSILKPRKMEIV